MPFFLRAGLLACVLFSGPALADAPDKADKSAAKPDAAAAKQAPLPADASVRQSTRVAGHSLGYTATVGTLPVRDAQGKTTGEVVFTAYTVDGKDRPVTFALNGGPGAASVYLNMGAIGPKIVGFGAEGDSASAPKATARRRRPRCATTQARGWTSPTWSSSTRSAPASAAH
ncbi:Serine carboxypeptidase (fragment) [Xanthomonas phaseoli pv. phaseoli]|uniref:Serine carboxypeptidase n=1 Tax=Xanthomonas campestris pv. phaseoli TaxID=317013 RepID=A0AB38DZT2_XANCH